MSDDQNKTLEDAARERVEAMINKKRGGSGRGLYKLEIIDLLLSFAHSEGERRYREGLEAAIQIADRIRAHFESFNAYDGEGCGRDIAFEIRALQADELRKESEK